MSDLALISSALSIGQVMDQRKLVMSLMKEAMTENTHYGKIPGCGEKPSLLQPGAQLLATTFHLVPSYKVDTLPSLADHLSIQVTCYLQFQSKIVCEGIGFCSSMESKFRYRNSAPTVEDTGEELPRQYWDIKKEQGSGAANKWLSTAWDGVKVGPKKFDDGWRVVRYIGGGEGKVENPNPVDTFNTVLKMGKKRAYVDAVISATACNDLFTQDLEDIRENLSAVEGVFVVETPQLALAAPETKGEPKQEDPKPTKKTKAQDLPEPERRKNAIAQFDLFFKNSQLTDPDHINRFWILAKETIGTDRYEDAWETKEFSKAWEKKESILAATWDYINSIPIPE